ncbi:zinc finger protein GAI-ASSOCIATED FACTOR 1-like [Punica granatum]|uniref:Zinc finger protein GAI-ASSOCIATED FACTOR 1-like n=2 Tax=Punica granatum TaxID=22663 RepID=A0A6P8CST6_PUNGR|nr:zinc finger protein GAI-ASSOCIATED FACTOR 1-like [Punica granatum]
MSNYVQDFEDDEQFQSTVVASQSSNGSPTNTSVTEAATDHASTPAPPPSRKKRNLPGNPDPDAEVVALSPRTLMATNRYICEVCLKGFQRDQNLQLHRRGHNLPWKLKQRPSMQPKKRVYICPEPSCVHHDPSRALGDLTGIKKHFCRKHGEKKWKCDKCSKRYAVQSDWKAHTKICGTREYRCDCGTIFSRKDSFVTHRAFCDALTEENNKMMMMSQRSHLAASAGAGGIPQSQTQELFTSSLTTADSSTTTADAAPNTFTNLFGNNNNPLMTPPLSLNPTGLMMMPSSLDPFSHRAQKAFGNASLSITSVYTSATALLQKAAEMGAKISDNAIAPILLKGFSGYSTNNTEAVMADNNSDNNSNGFHKTMDTESSIPIHHQQIGVGLLPSNAESLAGNGLLQGGGGEIFMGEGEKMTVDFLGVDPDGMNARGGVGGVGTKRSFHDDQQNLESFHSGW